MKPLFYLNCMKCPCFVFWKYNAKPRAVLFRSNFLGTKFIIYDTQPPYNGAVVPPVGKTSRRFNSTKVSPKVPSVSFSIAQVSYELNVLGTRGPRRMRCIMHSIPASSVEPGGIVPGQPEQIVPRALEDSFRSTGSFSQSFRSTTSLSKSIMDSSLDFSSARFSDIASGRLDRGEDGEVKERPLVLRNKPLGGTNSCSAGASTSVAVWRSPQWRTSSWLQRRPRHLLALQLRHSLLRQILTRSFYSLEKWQGTCSQWTIATLSRLSRHSLFA